jgi:hypothetical protein
MKHLSILIIIFSISQLTYSQKIENYTYKSDSISIKFTDTNPIDFQYYFDNKKLIDSISEKYGNWYDRAVAVEKYQLKKYNPKVETDNTNRIVTLKNGKKIVLTPDTKREEEGYTYEKSLLDGNLLLFRVQWYEGNEYCVINNLNGNKTYTFGRVYANPAGNLLISINIDIVAGYSSNGFQLFSIDKNYNLKKIWEYELTQWGPRDIKWTSNNTLVVLGNYYEGIDIVNTKNTYKKIEINVP